QGLPPPTGPASDHVPAARRVARRAGPPRPDRAPGVRPGPAPRARVGAVRDALGAVQSALVLGGGSDIGLATVRRLLTDGASRLGTVVLAARDAGSRLDPIADELRALRPGLEVDLVDFDADDLASHAALFGDVAARHGDIDLVLVAFGVLGDPDITREQPD